MIKLIKKITTIVFIGMGLMSLLPLQINAVNNTTIKGGFCDFIPCGIFGQTSANSSLDTVSSYIRFGISLVFIGIIIFGVYQIIKGALKIIRSEGDPSKIEEGANVFKGVFIGIIMIFAGVIGLLILIAFFSSGYGSNLNLNNPAGTNIPLLSQ